MRMQRQHNNLCRLQIDKEMMSSILVYKRVYYLITGGSHGTYILLSEILYLLVTEVANTWQFSVFLHQLAFANISQLLLANSYQLMLKMSGKLNLSHPGAGRKAETFLSIAVFAISSSPYILALVASEILTLIPINFKMKLF